VTKVEEWTNAETGVGAAMAAGNHAENGTWALLVIAPIIINKISVLNIFLFSKKDTQNSHEWSSLIITIDKIKNTSPTRLVITVNIPAFMDLLEKK
jgi:hypothetical protein